MGRNPCCSNDGMKKGAWTAMEDQILRDYVKVHGEGKWGNVPKRAGLKRCGKSCRLRWLNYLRPDIKRGNITPDEEDLIIRLHKLLGNRWSLIAGRLPGRTDNEIKNYWNSNLSKRATQGKQLSKDNSESDKNPIAKSHCVLPSNPNANAISPGINLIATQQQHNPYHLFTDNGYLVPPINFDRVKDTGAESQSSDGLGSLTSKEEDNLNSCIDQFVTDFSTIEDLGFLDSDFAKLSDLDIYHLTNFTEDHGTDDNKADMVPHFSSQAILATQWSSGSSGDCLQANMDSDLGFLSSFLESEEGWVI